MNREGREIFSKRQNFLFWGLTFRNTFVRDCRSKGYEHSRGGPALQLRSYNMATQLSYPFTKYLVDGSGGWVGWQLNASAKDIGGGGGSSRLLACKISQKQTNKQSKNVCTQSPSSLSNWKKTEKTYLNMLFSSQLGTQSERCDFRAAAAISKSFLHTAGNAAQQEARTTPTHET